MSEPVTVYITDEDLAGRMSLAELRRAYDDDQDGEADFDPLDGLKKDASSMVSGYIRNVYDFPLPEPYPHEVIRLTLDVAVAMAALRFPTALPSHDGMKLMEIAERQLRALRKGDTRLDRAGAPEPGANQGAKLFGQRSDGCPPKKFFVGGMGEF